MQKPNRKIFLLFFIFLMIIYAPFVFKGGFEYDDWSAAGLARGVSCTGLINAYHCDWPNYPDRPLASAFYSINSNLFHMWAPGYILLSIVMLTGAILLMFKVFEQRFGSKFATSFLFLAAVPSLSTTIIFSPAMQSIGCMALLMWAVSFYFLNKYLNTSNKRQLRLCFGFLLASLLFYESSLPLFGLSLAWPYIVAKQRIKAGYWTQYLKTFIAPIALILLIVVLYQKFFVLHFYPNISKVRFQNTHEMFSIAMRTIANTIYILTVGVFNFCIHGLNRVRHFSVSSLILFLAAVGSLAMALILSRRQTEKKHVQNYSLWRLSSAFLMVSAALALIHFIANSPPTFVGYRNRAVVAGSMIIAVAGAVLWDRFFSRRGRLWMAVGVVLFASYVSTFIVQRNNYDLANSERLKIAARILPLAEANYEPHMFILANAPVYTKSNFNNETIFSDEVLDWSNMLKDLSGNKTIDGISLTPGRLTRGELVIRNNELAVMHDNKNLVPINKIWYYDVNTNQLTKVQTQDRLASILNSARYFPDYPAPVDVRMRNNLRDWLASY